DLVRVPDQVQVTVGWNRKIAFIGPDNRAVQTVGGHRALDRLDYVATNDVRIDGCQESFKIWIFIRRIAASSSCNDGRWEFGKPVPRVRIKEIPDVIDIIRPGPGNETCQFSPRQQRKLKPLPDVGRQGDKNAIEILA